MENTAQVIDFIDAYIYRNIERINEPQFRPIIEHFAKNQCPSRNSDPNCRAKIDY